MSFALRSPRSRFLDSLRLADDPCRNFRVAVQTDEGIFRSDSGITIAFLFACARLAFHTGISCFRAVGVMRKPRFALILFVLLVFGLTLAVPAEDVLETTYDESETQPYEAIPLLSIASPLTASGMTQAVLNDARLRSDTPF